MATETVKKMALHPILSCCCRKAAASNLRYGEVVATAPRDRHSRLTRLRQPFALAGDRAWRSRCKRPIALAEGLTFRMYVRPAAPLSTRRVSDWDHAALGRFSRRFFAGWVSGLLAASTASSLYLNTKVLSRDWSSASGVESILNRSFSARRR